MTAPPVSWSHRRCVATASASAALTIRTGSPRRRRPRRGNTSQTLASDKLDGRLTGSAGERLAADYIVSQLEKIGARPVPGQTDYRVPFEFTAGSRDGGSKHQPHATHRPAAPRSGRRWRRRAPSRSPTTAR